MKKIVNNLKTEYRKIFSQKENKLEWFVKKNSNPDDIIHPPIPFVGKDYNKTKILLYASSEDLSKYKKNKKIVKYLDDDDIAIDRHRFCYENIDNYCFENDPSKSFFPFLHIRPVNNGSLIVLTAYLVDKLLNLRFKTPYELIQNMAVGNFCKFSHIINDKHFDGAKDINNICTSIKYIEVDLKLLRPNIIIIPEKIYIKKEVSETINKFVPNAKIIPIYQITPTTINTTIHKYNKEKRKSELSDWIIHWHENIPQARYSKIKGKIKDNYYSIYTYLDKLLRN